MKGNDVESETIFMNLAKNLFHRIGTKKSDSASISRQTLLFQITVKLQKKLRRRILEYPVTIEIHKIDKLEVK